MHVRPGHEGPAFALKDEHPNGGVPGHFFQGLPQLAGHLLVHGVKLVGPVEGQGGDALGFGQQNVVESHGVLPDRWIFPQVFGLLYHESKASFLERRCRWGKGGRSLPPFSLPALRPWGNF